MALPQDVIECIQKDFPETEVPALLAQIESASESARVQRCIAFAAHGHPCYFGFLCRLAQVDYRDVIMAGEYERLGERLYDFSHPIPEARLSVDRYTSPDVLRK